MAFKLLAFVALISVAHAGNLALPAAPAIAAYAAPEAPLLSYAAQPAAIAAPALARVAALPVPQTVIAEPHAPAQYSFGYSVSDALTGDEKSQVETRNGDNVQGSYSLLEADGTRRIVDYVADPINGFNAAVRKEPAGGVAVKAVQPTAAIATPAAYSAPALAYSAPLISKQIAAPAFAYSAGPAISYGAAPAISYGAAPAISYGAAPALSYSAAPAISYGASPLIHHL